MVFRSVYFSPSALPLSGQLSKAGSSRRAQPTLGGFEAGVRSRATPRLRTCPSVRRDALWGCRSLPEPGWGRGSGGEGRARLLPFLNCRIGTPPPKPNDTELAGKAVKKHALSHIASGNPKSYELRGGEFSKSSLTYLCSYRLIQKSHI